MTDCVWCCLGNDSVCRSIRTADDGCCCGVIPPRNVAYAPSDAELAALQCDLEELERADPAVRASAEAMDAAIRRLNRRPM